VQVGEVLDLRDGQEARAARAPAPAPGSRSRRAGCRRPARCRSVACRPAGDPVDPALAADVLAEHDRSGRAAARRAGSAFGGRQRALPGLVVLGSRRPWRRCARSRVEWPRATSAGPAPAGGAPAGATPPRRSRWPVATARGAAPGPAPGRRPAPASSSGDGAGAEQLPRRAPRADRGLRRPRSPRGAVGLLDVAAGVAPQPDGLEVEEDGAALAAGQLDRVLGRRPDLVELALRPDVGEARQRLTLRSTQPRGVATEMPMPLSSQTNSTGSGPRPRRGQRAALRRRCAVAWLRDASPNEHHHDGVVGHVRRRVGDPGPRRRRRSRRPCRRPSAGATRSSRSAGDPRSRLPQTLCRPWRRGRRGWPVSDSTSSMELGRHRPGGPGPGPAPRSGSAGSRVGRGGSARRARRRPRARRS
jgi:translation initiation factor IF-2